MIHSAPYRCPYCGAPAWREPHEIEPPIDYCHEEAHGSWEGYLREYGEDTSGEVPDA